MAMNFLQKHSIWKWPLPWCFLLYVTELCYIFSNLRITILTHLPKPPILHNSNYSLSATTSITKPIPAFLLQNDVVKGNLRSPLPSTLLNKTNKRRVEADSSSQTPLGASQVTNNPRRSPHRATTRRLLTRSVSQLPTNSTSAPCRFSSFRTIDLANKPGYGVDSKSDTVQHSMKDYNRFRMAFDADDAMRFTGSKSETIEEIPAP